MKTMKFGEAVDSALASAMAEDKTIFLMGEDVHALHANIFAHFGKERVKSTPISESVFLGASVTAAMAGLKPVVEIMLIDFIAVAADAVLNHAAKVEAFSGGKWNVPLVIRASCGGGYGDGGQHEQTLWGWLAHIPGISVVAPSNPADAGGLMLAALQSKHPVVYLEHKLLSEQWLDYLGSGGRKNVSYDIPKAGAIGEVPDKWVSIPYGKAKICREGNDITLISVAVGVHRALEAATILEQFGISVEVIDLRFISPLDKDALIKSVKKTGAAAVIDEDYQGFGLSGEISAILLENELSFKYGRVCTETTIPFSRKMEDETLPNTKRIVDTVKSLLKR
jgi:pyruvate dehydrogenase E1 component beta subunit